MSGHIDAPVHAHYTLSLQANEARGVMPSPLLSPNSGCYGFVDMSI